MEERENRGPRPQLENHKAISFDVVVSLSDHFSGSKILPEKIKLK